MGKILDNDPMFEAVGEEPDLSIFTDGQGNATQVNVQKDRMATEVPNLTGLERTPDLKSATQAIDDQGNQYLAKKDVETALDQGNTIDGQTADVVAESFPSLYQQVPKGAFTSVKTRSGLKETRTFVKTALATEAAVLVDAFKVYINDPVTASQAVLEEIRSNYLPALMTLLKSFQDELTANRIQWLEGKSEAITNLVTAPLDNLNIIDGGPVTQKTVALFHRSAKAVLDIYNSSSMAMLVWAGLSNVGEVRPTCTIASLVKLFGETPLVDNLGSMSAALERDQAQLNQLLLQAQAVADKPDQIAEFVIANAQAFATMATAVAHYASSVRNLTLLLLALKELLLNYAQL